VDEKTQTALARVVLPNPQGEWRPGLFVTAELAVGEENAPVVIPKTAVQRMGGDPVVFIETSDGLEPVPVSLGRSNTTHIAVLSGLQSGQRYVAQGAFELKAKIVTSGLGAHAGHGH
jgi:cobalt-zinc-cadmium efflux system membrane fusion protein